MYSSVNYLDVMRDIVGDFMEPFIPTVTMTVYYGNLRLTNGCELKVRTAQTTPRVLIGGEGNELYTLVMINPDAPNPNEPLLREVVSWIVTDIPGGTSCAQGIEFMSYDRPDPEVGIQRYIMLLYKQKSQLNGIETLPSRICFKSSDFANKHNLEKPVGITYFNVRRQPRRDIVLGD